MALFYIYSPRGSEKNIHLIMKAPRFTSSIAFLLLVCLTVIRAAPNGSLITNVPGFAGRLPSKHHAGYWDSWSDNVRLMLISIIVWIDQILASQVCFYWWEANWEEESLLLLCCFWEKSVQGSCCSVAQWGARLLQLWWIRLWTRWVRWLAD